MSLLHSYDVELVDANVAVGNSWAEAWTLPPRMTLSEWSDANRIIAKGAGAEPGPWRTDRNPPLREIMDCLSDHSPVQLVDFQKSAQIGATEIGINWTGYVIDRGSDSMIVAQPVKDLARSWATAKFDPAVLEMPDLLAKLGTDNTLEKRFPGGTVWIIWANSSKQLRQRTARYIFMDEVDEYPKDVGGQGPADQQLEARGMSYGDRAKIYRACTPTIEGLSAINAGFLAGDQRHYYVACPHCGEHQLLEIERLQPDGTFACAAHGCVIEEFQKDQFLKERGFGGSAYWKPHNLDAPPEHRSYHLWAAYAPLGLGLSWKAIAVMRDEAQNDPSKQAGFRNLVLGQTHAGERLQQEGDVVATLAEPGVQLGNVPTGGLVLSAGVDWQHDRAEVQVIATGRGQRRWVVDYEVIDADPTKAEDHLRVDAYLRRTWPSASGMPMAITAVAIDGGNWTEMVAQYVKNQVSLSGQGRLLETCGGFISQHIYLVRGRSEKKSDRAVYRPAKSEVNQQDKTIARSVGVWGVGGSVLNHMIYGWIRAALAERDRAEQNGDAEAIDARMLRFPGGRGEAYDPLSPDPGALEPKYYKGLTCEYYDQDAGQWINPRGARNEPLDTLKYAVWASLSPAIKADIVRDSQWAALESKFQPETADLFAPKPDPRETSAPLPTAQIAKPASPDSRETPRRGGGFTTRDGWGL